jgi:osmoprotectant transport system ATP-binding protein
MALIEVRDLTKVYPGGVGAVDRVDLDVEEGETLVLIGTSGSGKTTLMKMINRLIEPTSGRVRIRGSDVGTINPIALRREIGYVIQKIGLFPHMTIEENISVVPRLKGWPRDRQREQARQLLSMVGLEPDEFLRRYPGELSGGQQQRIGVARALAGEPPIILMDEPFGALDPITREQLQEEFRQLKERIEKTIIFVTHDIFEAVNLADRMAIMDSGRILQVDAPERVLARPADEFVARFLGKHRFQLEMTTVLVKDVMDEEPVVVRLTGGRQSVARAVELMRRHRVTTLFAVDGDSKLVGAVTSGALRRAPEGADLRRVVVPHVPVVGPESDLLTAMHVMADSDYAALPVPDESGRLLGVLNASDLIGVFADGLTGNGVQPSETTQGETPAGRQAGEERQG